jgi:hypothetical protein
VDAFLDELAARLHAYGFTVHRDAPLDGFAIRILAWARRLELSKFGRMARVIAVTVMDPATPGSVERFSALATDFALHGGFATMPRGLGGAVLSVPAVAAERVDPETTEWIARFRAKKHWAAFEYPVLISLADRRLYHNRTTPFWGAAYYRGFRRFVEEVLRV